MKHRSRIDVVGLLLVLMLGVCVYAAICVDEERIAVPGGTTVGYDWSGYSSVTLRSDPCNWLDDKVTVQQVHIEYLGGIFEQKTVISSDTLDKSHPVTVTPERSRSMNVEIVNKNSLTVNVIATLRMEVRDRR